MLPPQALVWDAYGTSPTWFNFSPWVSISTNSEDSSDITVGPDVGVYSSRDYGADADRHVTGEDDADEDKDASKIVGSHANDNAKTMQGREVPERAVFRDCRAV